MRRLSDDEVRKLGAELEARLGREQAAAVINASTLFISCMGGSDGSTSALSDIFHCLCKAKGWDFYALSLEMIEFSAKALGLPEKATSLFRLLSEAIVARKDAAS